MNNQIAQRNPIYLKLLFLYILVAPLDFYPIFQGVSLSRILTLMIIILFFYEIKNIKVSISISNILLTFYLVFATISIVFSSNLYSSLNGLSSIILNVVFVILISSKKLSNNQMIQLRKAILSSSLVLLFLVLFFRDTSSTGRLIINVFGIKQDPNEFVGYMILPIITIFHGLKIKIKIVFLVLISSLLGIAVLIGSRGGLLAILVSVVAYFSINLILQMKNSPLKLSRLLYIVIFITLFIIFFTNYVPNYILSRFNLKFVLSDGGSGRLLIWQNLIANYLDFPFINLLFGIGIGNIQNYSIDFLVAHNVWIETLVELGVFGFLCLFSVYISYIFKSYRKKQYILLSSLIGYLALGLSLSLISYKPIWLIFILINIYFNDEKLLSTNAGDKKNE